MKRVKYHHIIASKNFPYLFAIVLSSLDTFLWLSAKPSPPLHIGFWSVVPLSNKLFRKVKAKKRKMRKHFLKMFYIREKLGIAEASPFSDMNTFSFKMGFLVVAVLGYLVELVLT